MFFIGLTLWIEQVLAGDPPVDGDFRVTDVNLNNRVTSSGDFRVVGFVPVNVRFTDDGNTRTTSDGNTRVVETV